MSVGSTGKQVSLRYCILSMSSRISQLPIAECDYWKKRNQSLDKVNSGTVKEFWSDTAYLAPMKVFYSPNYYADIGDGHVFPIRKFELVRDRLLQEGTLRPRDLIEPEPASIADVLQVHTEDYVTRLRAGTLSKQELRRLGLPWSESLVRRSFYAVGGTMAAARTAMESGIGSNLAGGTHHAFADRGEGFCVLNDVAIGIRTLQRDRMIRRCAVVDCDVHQGNGTATIFAGEGDVFTLSVHGAKNYPLFKARSSLDVELDDGTTDASYLSALRASLPAVFAHQPDIVFYLGGADPYAGDKLGAPFPLDRRIKRTR